MPVVEVKGKSLEEIRLTWSRTWGCAPDQLELEVLDEPGFFSKHYRVRVSLSDTPEEPALDPSETQVTIELNEDRYILKAGLEVKRVIPFPLAGSVFVNGEQKTEPFSIVSSDIIEFVPVVEPGTLTWDIEVRLQGLTAVANVVHKKPGRYVLPSVIKDITVLELKQHVQWEAATDYSGEYWDEHKFKRDLSELKITHGIIPNVWERIIAVESSEGITVAQAQMPVPPVQPQVEDYVGEIEVPATFDGDRVDFFGSKVKLVNEGDVLARKIPGKPGVPGFDIFGKQLPAQGFRDRQLRARRNVHLSDDGLQVIASSGGLPRRLDEWTYTVENVYVLNGDVDLASGSIEFTGDVIIYGNVQDGFHVHAGGKVEISGSVSRGEIRAEKGLKVVRNILASKVVVGEDYVNRTDLFRQLTEVKNQLEPCLEQAELLADSEQAKNLTPSQCLKILLERKFPDLPRRAGNLEDFVLKNKGEFITNELIVAVRTIKHFLSGLGPLELQSVPFLKRALTVVAFVVDNMSVEIPDRLSCVVDYVQGSTIECGGDFECSKGTYNSTIRANGNLKIDGVCRGGMVSAGGDITIRELGGLGVSTTTVKMSGNKRMKVGLCHPNVIVYVDKHIIRIDEAYKEVEIYREKGIVQMEKLRVHHDS